MSDNFGLTTVQETIAAALDDATATDVADLLSNIKLGTQLAPLKVTITGLGAATVVDITAAATLAAATIVGALQTLNAAGLLTGLPPIAEIVSLDVTGAGGGNKPGVYVASSQAPYDAGATTPGSVQLSDNGKTLTFNSQVTAFVIKYRPLPAVDMSGQWHDANRE